MSLKSDIISFFQGFIYALNGIIFTLKGRNFRFQFVCGLFAIILSFVLKISSIEWLVVLILIALVLAAETFNTSIEEMANVIKKHDGIDYLATKNIRDLAAGAVLILSIFSFIIGLIIFLPKII